MSTKPNEATHFLQACTTIRIPSPPNTSFSYGVHVFTIASYLRCSWKMNLPLVKSRFLYIKVKCFIKNIQRTSYKLLWEAWKVKFNQTFQSVFVSRLHCIFIRYFLSGYHISQYSFKTSKNFVSVFLHNEER